MKEINVAIIGTGIIANEHVGRYRKIEGVNIVAACDLDEAKLNAFCDKWDIPNRYTDYREMLRRDDIIAVDVCLHNNLHAPISVAVMAAGKNCYCEKPMAGSYIDAVAMKNAAAEFNVELHIQLAYLFTPHTTCAKKIIDAGRLGKIYHTRSYGYRRRGRPFVDGYGAKEFVSKQWAGHGALFDMGVYHISQLLYLLDTPEVERVSGAVYQEVDMDESRKTQSGYDVEELGVGFVKFKDALTMDIMESWAIHGGKSPPSSIHGSTGGLQINNSYIPEDNYIIHLSEIEGYPAETTFDIAAEQYRQRKIDPSVSLFNNPQTHWIGVLRG
ncbi:MAG: Gfo/Idh/MocA family oxidoreductase, partial [Oscillospiraceae bacterium]|nr:Gfo/Idh/MocA family oxidoreductase [Oscillospiraceae bacterium]